MAHRTLKDIAALYRFGLPEGRLNGKGREASLSIASSQSPAVLPGNGSTTRVRDPSNSAPANQIGSGSRNTHRPLDTRRYRVNKIEGEEEPSRTGIIPHRTPMSSVGLSGMLNSHFLRSADRPLLPCRSTLQVPHEGGGLKLHCIGGNRPP